MRSALLHQVLWFAVGIIICDEAVFAAHYQFYADAKSWDKAAEDCRERGGWIASVASENENIQVAAVIGSVGSAVWIGGNDDANEGCFIWAEGPLRNTQIKYAKWADSEPNNRENEDCIALQDYDSSTKQLFWNDRKCSSTFGYVCEFRNEEGLFCSGDQYCESGICREGKCCSKSVGPSCAGCNATGHCMRCDSQAILSDGACILKLSPGALCVNNVVCLSGNCLIRCCTAQAGSACAQCGEDGICDRCVAGYSISGFGHCYSATRSHTRSHLSTASKSLSLLTSNTNVTASQLPTKLTPTYTVAVVVPSTTQSFPLPRPPPRARVVLIGKLFSDTTAARGVAAGSEVATAVSGSATLPATASRLMMLSSVQLCSSLDSDLDDVSIMTHPLPGPSLWSIPIAGPAVVQYAFFVFFPLAMLSVLAAVRVTNCSSYLYYFGFVCSVLLAFFAPVAAEDASILLSHPKASSASMAVAGIFCSSCIAFLLLLYNTGRKILFQ